VPAAGEHGVQLLPGFLPGQQAVHGVGGDALGGVVNRPEFRAASFLVRKDAIMPKHYDAEVKARAVRLVTEHKVESGSVTKSCEAVGRRLGISKETLRGWCRQAQVDAGEREGVSSEELAEIKRLKAENRRLREDVEILRAATTFFAGELDPRNR
jgi:transposase-like protein